MRTFVALVLGLLLLTGCSDSPDEAAEPKAPATTTAAPPAVPRAGVCTRPTFADVLASKPSTAVPCKGRHTARTVYVGTIDPLVDGHLLAVDSDSVQRQIAAACRSRVGRYLGGSTEDQRLSRLQAAWFSPTLEESDAGALWYRCDVVYVAGPDQLAPLPVRLQRILSTTNKRRPFATCGTTSPAAPAFKRVACARAHGWRARATITLPAGTRYLGAKAAKGADSRCRDITARIARNSLKLKWSFEWPTKAQWATGQRYGICWTPDPA